MKILQLKYVKSLRQDFRIYKVIMKEVQEKEVTIRVGNFNIFL